MQFEINESMYTINSTIVNIKTIANFKYTKLDVKIKKCIDVK